jgi:hypothetical protein
LTSFFVPLHPKSKIVNEDDVDVGFYIATLAGYRLYQLAHLVYVAFIMDWEIAGHCIASRLVPADVCWHLAIHRQDAHAPGYRGLRDWHVKHLHLALSLHDIPGVRPRQTA